MALSKHIIEQVLEKKALGKSNRQISRELFGTSTRESTIRGILKRYESVEVAVKVDSPKILVVDIETAPVIGYHWGLWQQNIGLNMILRNEAIISFSAKWVGEDAVMYDDCREFFDGSAASMVNEIDDKDLIENLWILLDEADIIVTQNGKKFDAKKINARFLHHGLQPPSSYKHIDTLQIAKRHFAFTSNKLEYMTDRFCKVYKKLKHGNFAGFDLWKECQLGNPLAWDEMETYNKYDVLSLEELLFILAPWSDKMPNMDMYYDDEENHCFCGITEWESDGFAYTSLSKFTRHKCTSCGAEKRGRVNLLAKSKRKTLQMNVTN